MSNMQKILYEYIYFLSCGYMFISSKKFLVLTSVPGILL